MTNKPAKVSQVYQLPLSKTRGFIEKKLRGFLDTEQVYISSSIVSRSSLIANQKATGLTIDDKQWTNYDMRWTVTSMAGFSQTVPQSTGSFDSAPPTQKHCRGRFTQEDSAAVVHSAAFLVTGQVHVLFYAATIQYD
jgi:hypothetical protein